MSNPEPSAGRPRVRPRVRAAQGGTLRLEDEIADLLSTQSPFVAAITGGPGSGKTFALAYLIDRWAHSPVAWLDGPAIKEVHSAAQNASVVYTAPAPLGITGETVFALAPWGQDEWIEYLLGVAPHRCAGVMNRVLAMQRTDGLAGTPELWAAALDLLISDDTPQDLHHVLRNLAVRLGSPDYVRKLSDQCLYNCRCDAPMRDIAGWAPGLARHAPVFLTLAAERLVDRVKNHETDALAHRLRPDLLGEAARRLSADHDALRTLADTLAWAGEDIGPMAASLLHAAGSSWRPVRGQKLRLDHARLAGVAWPGVDLGTTSLRYAELTGANLVSARLDGAILSAADLSDARLAHSTLQKADLAYADLSGADLRQADFTKAALSEANLRAAVLNGARLESATLRLCSLADARLVRCSLRDSVMDRCDLEGADLSGADLSGATLRDLVFRQTTLASTTFTECRMDDCNLEGIELPAAEFSKAVLRNVDLTGSVMRNANFSGARFERCGLAEIWWEGADLRGADFRGCTFHMGSSRSGLVFSPIACQGSRTGFYTDEFDEQDYKPPEEISKADLRGADLRGAVVDGVDFYLVDLRGARYDRAQAEWFRKCRAILADRL